MQFPKLHIFINVSVLKIDSVMFHLCGAQLGAVQLRSVGHGEVTNSQWDESTNSSAIFIKESNTVISDCQFMRSACSHCRSGGIHAENSSVTFTGSNDISHNNVSEIGAGLSNPLRAPIEVDGCRTSRGVCVTTLQRFCVMCPSLPLQK